MASAQALNTPHEPCWQLLEQLQEVLFEEPCKAASHMLGLTEQPVHSLAGILLPPECVSSGAAFLLPVTLLPPAWGSEPQGQPCELC